MKQITDYREVSPLILGYYRRGVVTNCFLSAEDFRAEITEGGLFYISSDSYLLFFLRRGDFYRMYFYTFSKTVPLPVTGLTIVSEAVGDGAEFLLNNGFLEYTTRTRLEREENAALLTAKTAEKSDCAQILQLMEKAFDRYSGYLPVQAQLETECDSGLILKIEENNSLAGILRFGKSGKKLQIKHLCVDENYRGKGLGKQLINALPQGKCSVWTGTDNLPALNLYKTAGFYECGELSTVYMKG